MLLFNKKYAQNLLNLTEITNKKQQISDKKVTKRGINMIEVTKLNDQKVLINPDLIELVQETPDTVISFTTGRKIIVKESRQEVKNLVKLYRKEIFAE